jgi:hypothetical protein
MIDDGCECATRVCAFDERMLQPADGAGTAAGQTSMGPASEWELLARTATSHGDDGPAEAGTETATDSKLEWAESRPTPPTVFFHLETFSTLSCSPSGCVFLRDHLTVETPDWTSHAEPGGCHKNDWTKYNPTVTSLGRLKKLTRLY